MRAGQQAGAVRTDFPPSLLAATLLGMATGLDSWFLQAWEADPTPELHVLGVRSVELFRDTLDPRTGS